MKAKLDSYQEITAHAKFHRRVKMLAFQTRSTKPKYRRIPELTTWHQSCSRSSGIRVSEWRETFDVTVVGNDLPDRSKVSGSLGWSDGVHNVRSPIVVYAFNVVDVNLSPQRKINCTSANTVVQNCMKKGKLTYSYCWGNEGFPSCLVDISFFFSSNSK